MMPDGVDGEPLAAGGLAALTRRGGVARRFSARFEHAPRPSCDALCARCRNDSAAVTLTEVELGSRLRFTSEGCVLERRAYGAGEKRREVNEMFDQIEASITPLNETPP